MRIRLSIWSLMVTGLLEFGGYRSQDAPSDAGRHQ